MVSHLETKKLIITVKKMKAASGSKNLILTAPVYLVVFSAFFDTHAQMPVLAPFASSLGATPFVLGIVVGVYSLFNMAGNFAGGATIDRKGWKTPLFIGLIGATLLLLLYTTAQAPYHLVLIRAGHGFLGGFLVPSALACLTIGGSKGESRFYGSRLAFFGATIGLAAVTGPMVAGIIAGRFGFAPVYLILAVVMAVSTIVAARFFRDQAGCSSYPEAPGLNLFTLFKRQKMLTAFICALGTMGSTGTLASFLPTRAAAIGMGHAETGALFATFALVAIFVQMLWPRKLKPLLKSDSRGCMLGLLLLASALSMAAFATSPAAMFSSLAIYGTGFGFSFQGMLGLVISDSDESWRGRAIGIFFAVYSLGVAVVPPVSGLIWQHQQAIFPFYTAAAFALVSFFLVVKRNG